MGLFGQIFGQAAGATPPPDRPPQRGPQKRDKHRDDRPPEDKDRARKHYDDEVSEGGEGNGGEQKDGRLW